jgi:hypothetical protein
MDAERFARAMRALEAYVAGARGTKEVHIVIHHLPAQRAAFAVNLNGMADGEFQNQGSCIGTRLDDCVYRLCDRLGLLYG